MLCNELGFNFLIYWGGGKSCVIVCYVMQLSQQLTFVCENIKISRGKPKQQKNIEAVLQNSVLVKLVTEMGKACGKCARASN